MWGKYIVIQVFHVVNKSGQALHLWAINENIEYAVSISLAAPHSESLVKCILNASVPPVMVIRPPTPFWSILSQQQPHWLHLGLGYNPLPPFRQNLSASTAPHLSAPAWLLRMLREKLQTVHSLEGLSSAKSVVCVVSFHEDDSRQLIKEIESHCNT